MRPTTPARPALAALLAPVLSTILLAARAPDLSRPSPLTPTEHEQQHQEPRQPQPQDPAPRQERRTRPEGAPDAAPQWHLGVFFWHSSPNDAAALRGIREALAIAAPGADLVVRNAEEDPTAAARLLDELRSAQVDLIFAMGTQAALHAAARVHDVPIVYTAVTNPVESALVPTWKGSGRNVAGNSNWIAPDTLLRVFRLAVPKLTRLGILRSRASGVVSAAELRAMRQWLAQPDAPDVQVIEAFIDVAASTPPTEPVNRVEAADPATDIASPGSAGPGIAGAVQKLAAQDVQAIWVPIDFLVYQSMPAVLAASRAAHLPVVSSSLRAARDGAVAGVVVDYVMLGKRAVVIALDVLQGRRPPGEIPVGTMQAYQVVVDPEAARRCGYELPLSLLVLADVVLGEDGDEGEDPDEHGGASSGTRRGSGASGGSGGR